MFNVLSKILHLILHALVPYNNCVICECFRYDEFIIIINAYKKKLILRWDYNCDENLYDEDPIACYESCMKISRRTYIQRIQISSPSNSIFRKMTMLILLSNSWRVLVTKLLKYQPEV